MTEQESLFDLFHAVIKALPESQELITLTSDVAVEEAIRIMTSHNISQVPVVAGNDEVLGIFSYRSFGRKMLELPRNQKFEPTLPIDLFLEENPRYATINEKLETLLDYLDIDGAVLVGGTKRLQGILTTIDVLRYFHKVARPYVLLREIELATRLLIHYSVTDDQLAECAERTLQPLYSSMDKPVPATLEEMTMHDYVNILRYKGHWDYFQNAWGGTCNTVSSRLDRIPDLRNDVFHFRRDLTVAEYDNLVDCREWIYIRMRKVEAEESDKE